METKVLPNHFLDQRYFEKKPFWFKLSCFYFWFTGNLTELKRSDIDIGLIGNEPILPQHLAMINEEIENLPMLYKIDLVNFNEVDDRFKTVALKNAEWL